MKSRGGRRPSQVAIVCCRTPRQRLRWPSRPPEMAPVWNRPLNSSEATCCGWVRSEEGDIETRDGRKSLLAGKESNRHAKPFGVVFRANDALLQVGDRKQESLGGAAPFFWIAAFDPIGARPYNRHVLAARSLPPSPIGKTVKWAPGWFSAVRARSVRSRQERRMGGCGAQVLRSNAAYLEGVLHTA
jgi:hypothetical protein